MGGAQKHVHCGLSSKAFLEPEKILRAAQLRKGDSVLDVGCGEGQFALAASRIVGESGTVYAIDFHEPSVNILRDKIASGGIENISAFVADAKNHIPVSDGDIDVCLMVNVLHGFAANEEIPGVMHEISRIVKKRGCILVVDFKKAASSEGPPMAMRLTPHEVEDILKQYDFVAEKMHDVGPYSYLLKLIHE
jgi:ubiquinone/menaquinone biosynthesis C-methylase UbiE